MILSHRHRFLFLKTSKTAGTSLEIALSEHCGDDDVITPISAEDEALRRELGFRGPQHHLRKRRGLARVLPGPVEGARTAKRDLLFYNHMPAREIRERVPTEVWDGYFKFCIERNPWDRFISFYYWRTKDQEPRPTISQFLDSDLPLRLKKRGSSLYSIEGQVVVDRVYRYEDLPGMLADLTKRLELPKPLVMPHAKGRYRKEKVHYRELLTAEEGRRIGELFADELELYGYRF
jgi:hypothetical protein